MSRAMDESFRFQAFGAIVTMLLRIFPCSPGRDMEDQGVTS